ncbi:MAG: SIMPL domain-containing protein [Pirellulaceae bacterium]|nr:SIMPL domain-containing protein [Pirellulaceae bacterium]
MKRTILCTMTAIFCGVTAWADDVRPPQVMVFGTATNEVVPDMMVWSLVVTNTGESLEKVAQRHSEVVAAVLTLLKDTKVPEETLQTARMEFGVNWTYRGNSWVREGYSASTRIAFKINDFGAYGALWMGLAKISEVSVESVSYDHSKRIDLRNETRAKALLAARKKATAMAEALGSKIGEPLLIEEDISVNEGVRQSAMSNFTEKSEPVREIESALAPGTIPIRARVKVAFRLVLEDQRRSNHAPHAN